MDFKEMMIEAIERGYATDLDAYDYVRDSYADAADTSRKRDKEDGQGRENDAEQD